jgi:hypothetical protein
VDPHLRPVVVRLHVEDHARARLIGVAGVEPEARVAQPEARTLRDVARLKERLVADVGGELGGEQQHGRHVHGPGHQAQPLAPRRLGLTFHGGGGRLGWRRRLSGRRLDRSRFFGRRLDRRRGLWRRGGRSFRRSFRRSLGHWRLSALPLGLRFGERGPGAERQRREREQSTSKHSR